PMWSADPPAGGTASDTAVEASIRPVTLDDIVGLERYEAMRDELRQRVIAHKRSRRVAVGPELTFVFENHHTVYFQIQEMLRAERISELDAVRAELAVYNALLPQPGELSATLLIEITDQSRVAERLLEFLGIDEATALTVGEQRIAAEFEPGRSREDKLSAVQYVRFSLPAAARSAFQQPGVAARLVVELPNYRHAAGLDGAVRASLAGDLSEAP
ncbi:MAG: DUF3501 family protein, partial [bacterium]